MPFIVHFSSKNLKAMSLQLHYLFRSQPYKVGQVKTTRAHILKAQHIMREEQAIKGIMMVLNLFCLRNVLKIREFLEPNRILVDSYCSN